MKTLKILVLPALMLALVLTGCGDGSGGGAGQQFNVTAANFDEVFNQIRETPGTYTLNLTGDLINYQGIGFDTPGVKITVKGTGTNQITWRWDANNQSPLFWVGAGELVLENIRLSRAQGNTQDWSLIYTEGGILEIRNGAVLNGGGVNNVVGTNGGSLRMTGGEISNGLYNGVGIDSGSFTMSGGTIRNNGHQGIWTSDDNVPISITMSGGVIENNDQGIWVGDNVSSVTISGGTIRNNRYAGIGTNARSAVINISGATFSGNERAIGIYNESANLTVSISGATITDNKDEGIILEGTGNTFTMTNTSISNTNTSDNRWDGIGVGARNATINISGGTISGYGGGFVTWDRSENVTVSISGLTITNSRWNGIYLDGNRNTVTMNSGTVSGGNHGVQLEGGTNNTFAMRGGTISNSGWGLGLQGANNSFRKTGGTIYGSDAGNNSNRDGAIDVRLGNSSQRLYGNAEGSKVYAATINAAGNGIVAGSLEGDGWVD